MDCIKINKELYYPRHKINKQPDYKIIAPFNKSNFSKNLHVNTETVLQTSRNLIYHKDIIETLLDKNVKFSFIDHIKSIFMSKTKRNILYRNANENLNFIMDIDKYLKFHLDMTLVKEILYDETQRIVFDNVTKLINLKKFFEENKEPSNSLKRYKKGDYENCFNGIKLMFSRNNSADNKILSLIEKGLKN